MKKFNEHIQLRCRKAALPTILFLLLAGAALQAQPGFDSIVVIFKPGTHPDTIKELRDSLHAKEIGYSTPSTARLWRIHCTPGDTCYYEGVAMTDVNEVIKKVASETKTEGCGKNYTTHLPPVMLNLPDQQPPVPSVPNLTDCGDLPIVVPEGETHPIIIALIDSGVKTTHTCFGGGGFFHVKSKSFIGGSHSVDGNGHGTHLAGIIRQMDDIVGGGNIKILNLKTQETDGSGTVWNAIRAVDWANVIGARIINMSLGYTFDTLLNELPDTARQPLEVAILKANQMKNILVVASAGNDGVDLDTFPHFPSAFRSQNLISVAADSCGVNLAWFSNFGDTTVDFSTPGVRILGPDIASNTSWTRKSGTSMAAAIASGAAGLLATHLTSANISDGKLKCALLTGADTMGWELVTHGKINADSSLMELTTGACATAPPLGGEATTADRSSADDASAAPVAAGGEGLRAFPIPFSDQLQVRFQAAQAGEAKWQVSNAFGQVTASGSVACLPGENIFEWNASGLPGGLYLLAVQVDGKRLSQKLLKQNH